jgi:hypothetical protein
MFATIIQVTGIGVVAFGVGIAYPPAGIVVAGVGLVLFGLALERSK